MTLLRCIHCGHEQTLYTPANGSAYYDLGGAAILCCRQCHGGAFRIVSEVRVRETETESARPRAETLATYAYGSCGEYVDLDVAAAERQAAATPRKRGE